MEVVVKEGVVFYPVGTALFTVFLMFCMEKGNIFGWWQWHLTRMPEWLAKPLGACAYCIGSWMCLCYCFFMGVDWRMLPICLGINYIVLRIIYKLKIN